MSGGGGWKPWNSQQNGSRYQILENSADFAADIMHNEYNINEDPNQQQLVTQEAPTGQKNAEAAIDSGTGSDGFSRQFIENKSRERKTAAPE